MAENIALIFKIRAITDLFRILKSVKKKKLNHIIDERQ